VKLSYYTDRSHPLPAKLAGEIIPSLGKNVKRMVEKPVQPFEGISLIVMAHSLIYIATIAQTRPQTPKQPPARLMPCRLMD